MVANDGFSELQQADGAWKYSSMSGSEKWMMNLLHMHRAQEKIHMRVVSVVSFSHQFVVFVFFFLGVVGSCVTVTACLCDCGECLS